MRSLPLRDDLLSLSVRWEYTRLGRARVRGPAKRIGSNLSAPERDMSRKALLAAAGFALFTALPVLTPSDEVKAYPVPQVLRGPEMKGCYLPGSGSSGINVMNTGRSATNVRVDYYESSGTPVTVTNTILTGPGSGYLPTPGSFRGSAVVSSDSPVAAIVNVFGTGTVDGQGSAYPCPAAYSSTGAIYPINDGKQKFVIQNLTNSQTDVLIWYYSPTGQTEGPGPDSLDPRETKQFSGKQVGADSSNVPGTGWPFNFTPSSFVAFNLLQQGSGKIPPLVLPGVDASAGDTESYMPLPFTSDAVVYSTTWSVHNPGSSPQSVKVTYFRSDGQPGPTITDTIPALGQSRGSVELSSGGPLVAIQNVSSDDTTINATYTGFNQRGRAAPGSGALAGTGASRLLTKRGYAFGAPSSKKSKVTAVLRNVGTKKAVVKLRVFDGDTGKKVQAGKATIAAGATATMPFKKRARGNNLYTEITIKGKGSVAAWLMRNFKGDVDFYAAVPR